MGKKIKALGLAFIGLFTLGYLLRSLSRGVINLGNKQREFLVSFADNPGLFLFGLLLMLVLAIGALAVARQFWSGADHD